MMRPQKAVLRETKHIAIGTVSMTAAMLAIYALLGKWNLTVLWGALAGMVFAIGNFFALGMAVQKAAGATPERGKGIIRASYSMRMLVMVVFLLIGVKLSFINVLAMAIPLVFPRLTIAIMQLTGMYKNMPAKHVINDDDTLPGELPETKEAAPDEPKMEGR